MTLHAEMPPEQRARVDASSGYGRALSAYAEAVRLQERGWVLPPYVEAAKSALSTALEDLLDAARAEGAASIIS